MRLLRRIDDAWARLEAVLLVVLFATLMVTVSMGATARASRVTFCLALIGASLATHRGKHMAFRLVQRFVSANAQRWMMATQALIAGVICLALSYSALAAVLEMLHERPTGIEYEIEPGPNICDMSEPELRRVVIKKPIAYCTLRAMLRFAGLPYGEPYNSIFLVMPIELLVMALRFLLYGASALRDDRDARIVG